MNSLWLFLAILALTALIRFAVRLRRSHRDAKKSKEALEWLQLGYICPRCGVWSPWERASWSWWKCPNCGGRAPYVILKTVSKEEMRPKIDVEKLLEVQKDFEERYGERAQEEFAKFCVELTKKMDEKTKIFNGR